MGFPHKTTTKKPRKPLPPNAPWKHHSIVNTPSEGGAIRQKLSAKGYTTKLVSKGNKYEVLYRMDED